MFRPLHIGSPLRLPHQIQRTSLDLIENSGDVLSDDSKRDQVDTGKKQKNGDDRRPTIDRVGEQQILNDDV